MNRKDKNLEALSAHLDGEQEDDFIKALLRDDALLNKRHEEYARLGALLRAMPDPDLHSAFTTRVMAHAREAGQTGPVWNLWRLLAPMAGLAALLIFAAFLALNETVTAPSTVASMPTEKPPLVVREDLTSEEVVVGEMARLIDQGVVLELYPEEEFVGEEVLGAEVVEEPEVLAEDWQEMIAREVYAYVASEHWNDTTEEVLWNAPDIEVEYEQLTEPQRAEFVELLIDYRENLS